MRLSRHNGSSPFGTQAATAETFQTTLCGECGALNNASDLFCSACGTALSRPDEPGWQEEASAAPATPPSDSPTEIPAPKAPVSVVPSGRLHPGSRPWWGYGLGVAFAAAVAGVVVFGLLWHSTSNHVNRLQGSLDSTRATLAQTSASLAATAAQLHSTTALAEKRRMVLVQAQVVLTKVDPLLSSVDAIQAQSGQMSTQGETLASDADNLVGALATATNYVAHTSPYAVNVSYYNSLIDTANSYYYALQSAEGEFASAESSYGSASSTFGTSADAFSASVRQLQRQLKGAVGP